jgi:hypothetical protein
MLGHLFSFLPFGSVAFRVNLMSAVFHAAAVGLTTLFIFGLVADDRTSSKDPPLAPIWAGTVAALVGGLSLAFAPAFWTYALEAEVFPLNSFFAALLLVLAAQWARQLPARGGQSGARVFGAWRASRCFHGGRTRLVLAGVTTLVGRPLGTPATAAGESTASRPAPHVAR